MSEMKPKISTEFRCQHLLCPSIFKQIIKMVTLKSIERPRTSPTPKKAKTTYIPIK